MGFDFLHDHNGQRLRFVPQVPEEVEWDETDDEELEVDRGVELPPDDWHPMDVLSAAGAHHLLPCRFIDGCHRGQTVAWVQDAEGHPVPVMLAEIGSVCLSGRNRMLRREFEIVERVVTMMIDPFPWHEIESFALALRRIGLRLLPANPPEDELGRRRATFDFQVMRQRTHNKSNYEMEVLEELALHQDPHQPSLVDGRLESRMHGLPAELPVVGVIKRHREEYLHDAGWRTFYRLKPGERTPLFRLPGEHLAVLSWYLRLAGGEGDLPDSGIIRVEITEAFFQSMKEPFDYVDALSAWIVEIRCRRQDYDRAAISLEPIVRAEDSLKVLFSPPDYLKTWFYRQTGM